MTSASLDRSMAATWTLAVVAAAVLFVVLKGNTVLADPDTQWHIAAGRLILETGAMPRVDTMSHTHAGQPWIAKEWLSQVLLHLAHALGGWPGVFLQTALCIAAAAAIVAWRLLKRAPPLVVMILAWVLVLSLLPVASARPHALALPVMALFATALLNAAETDQTPPWLALPLLTLWANLHAAFTLGFLMAACMGLDAVLRAPAERRLQLVGQWALFGVGCLAAACVHPYGAQSLLINLSMAQGNESIPLITEWNRHEVFGPTGFRIIVPAILIATLAIRWRTNAARLLLGGCALYLTWRHQRFIMLLAVIAPMMSRDAFMAVLAGIGERLKVFQTTDPLRDPKWRVPAALCCLAAFLALPFLGEKPAPPEKFAPTAALASVPPELRTLPVYNSYNLGGFLVLNRIPTFVDGRTDQLFSNNFIARFHDHMRAKDAAAFLSFIEGYGPRWAIVQTGQADVPLLASSPQWRETYSDDNAKVFVRVGG
jgi:hypothetical protein